MRLAAKLPCLLILAFLSIGIASADAAIPLTAGGSNADKPADQINPVKIAITPHRAVYTMSLGSVKNGSNISDVTGKMVFEWSDVCDGWAVQQHLQLHFTYAEGDESDVHSTELTWESKDGKQYNFNIRRVTDGKESERYQGKAVMGEDGGTVTYSVPAGKTDALPADTLFPSAHTIMILQKAAAAEKLFSRRVFDGSDEDGSNDVSVFISPQIVHAQQVDAGMPPKNDPLKNNPLLDAAAWPVRMAFFKINTETGEPDYEMNLTLLQNGIAKTMQIDYGDFSVTGILSAVEALPPSGC